MPQHLAVCYCVVLFLGVPLSHTGCLPHRDRHLLLVDDFIYLFGYHVAQFDVLRSRHRRCAVIFDQFIQRIKFDDPEEKFTLGVAQHFEMLDAI